MDDDAAAAAGKELQQKLQLLKEDFQQQLQQKKQLLQEDQWREELDVGSAVDAMGDSGKWYEGYIVTTKKDSLTVHFMGWSPYHDTIMSRYSGCIQKRHSRVTRWRNALEEGSYVEICVRDNGTRRWYKAQVVEVDAESGKLLVTRDEPNLSTLQLWVDRSGEDICMMGTHLLESVTTMKLQKRLQQLQHEQNLQREQLQLKEELKQNCQRQLELQNELQKLLNKEQLLQQKLLNPDNKKRLQKKLQTRQQKLEEKVVLLSELSLLLSCPAQQGAAGDGVKDVNDQRAGDGDKDGDKDVNDSRAAGDKDMHSGARTISSKRKRQCP